jgi:hypothetical protein
LEAQKFISNPDYFRLQNMEKDDIKLPKEAGTYQDVVLMSRFQFGRNRVVTSTDLTPLT